MSFAHTPAQQHNHSTRAHMPPYAPNGPAHPISTKWRESYRWHRREIGGTYRKSPLRKVVEHLEDASAPRFVTPLDRHRESAGFVANSIF